MNAAILPPKKTQIEHNTASWHAYLKLCFANRQRGVRLVSSEHEGPLYVQKAFYPEGPGCAHCYLLHPPGGLVTGDDLSISIQAESGAHALITTPGAGRVYKAREQGGVQSQSIHLTVAEHACLEWLPLETILFPHAQARLHTRIDLAEQAKVIAWDITCFGLPANDIPFNAGSVKQSLQVWSKGRLMLNERLGVDLDRAQHKTDASPLLLGNAGFRAKPVHGLLIAGPFEQADPRIEELIEALRMLSPGESQQGKDLFSVTYVGAFLSVRYLGWCTSSARLYFTEVWRCIRPVLMAREAQAPRIWAT
jgi:urease accessory protein